MSDLEQPVPESAQAEYERYQKLEKDLADTPEDDTSKSEKMNQLAGAIGDYYSKANILDEGHMIAALEISATAESRSPPGDFLRGSAMYTQMMLCFTLAGLTGLMDWLQKGTEFGCESIRYLKQNPNVSPTVYRRLISNRNEAVAVGFLKLFEHPDSKANPDHVEQAVTHQGQAVDYTVPSELGEDGLQKRYDRFIVFCELVTRWQVFRTKQEQEDTWATVINLVLTSHFYEEDERLHRASLWNLCALLTRRWVLTRQEDHLNELIERTSKEMRAGRTSAQKWCDDPESRQHVLRVAAGRFLAEVYETPIWEKHLESIDAAIAIWEEVRKGIKDETVDDLREQLDPVIQIRDLYERKYKITKIASDGWTSEKLSILSTNMSATIIVHEKNQKDDEEVGSKSWVLPGATSCVIGTSIVTGTMFMIFGNTGFGMNDFRLMFSRGESLDDNWVPTVDNWIREWKDDGTYALGGVVEGRDDDVLEYIRDYRKKPEQKD